jgi:HAD superfamily hydrolase (TIGR01662 family)
VTIRAVLFDVGGPLDAEVVSERLIDADIRDALKRTGRDVSDAEFKRASEWAVEVFAPNAYSAIVWMLSGCDAAIANAVMSEVGAGSNQRNAARGGIELRPGVAEMLARLYERGLQLGLAANQPARVITELDQRGIGKLFAHREVSGHHGYRKPDTRLFLRACEDLAIEPAVCVMVGDRIDNDVAPAKVLGMRTALFRTGRHIAQQPRSAEEVPDVEAWDVAGMEAAIVSLL